jgi:hypothetical protein
MSAKCGWRNFLAVAMLASLSSLGFANTPAANMVTGQVTAVAGGDHISVNGQLYAVKPSSPASATLPQVRVGQTVDILLDNPPRSPLAQVVVIHVH